MTDKAISINKTVKIVLFGLFLMHCPILSPKYAAICLERLKFHKNCYFCTPVTYQVTFAMIGYSLRPFDIVVVLRAQTSSPDIA